MQALLLIVHIYRHLLCYNFIYYTTIYKHICTRIYIYIYLHKLMHTNMHMCIHTHIYIYIYKHLCIYIYICIFLCRHGHAAFKLFGGPTWMAQPRLLLACLHARTSDNTSYSVNWLWVSIDMSHVVVSIKCEFWLQDVSSFIVFLFTIGSNICSMLLPRYHIQYICV